MSVFPSVHSNVGDPHRLTTSTNLDETRAPNQKGKRQKTTSPEYDSVKQRANLCADYPSVHLPSHLRSFTHITPTSLRDDVILVSETDAGRTPEAS